ncbi:PREDICTED: L-type lectin-domain containing receptor kinase VIII.2-like isoform X2 [Lupinus angustifolius]|uniref:L-type lectin-domain containing receptor kinase VIII.2-like isoform X2 n=1 Tax=Lupinus angustifolius TaxID=3871 RepID=UPI00092EF6E3|nr:PREDICTED: L-type lectin-domain containing receptor kinase VIII.2-like isoform X2 [Lupinus angustifolius]
MRIEPRHTVFVVPFKHNNGMGKFSFSLFFFTITISLLILLLQVQPSSTQSLTGNPNFDADIDLFGDAKVVVGEQESGSHVKLSRSSSSSSGLLLRRNPIKFVGPTSFSTNFSFSISPDAGDGVVFVLVPGERDFSSKFSVNDSFGVFVDENYVAVEFDTSKDDNVNDLNANHVGIDVGSIVSVAVANVSSINLVLNSGENLNAWVDYESGSKNLQVWLSKEGESRPKNVIVSHNIDLFKIWGDQNVFLGITSSSNHANSKQVVSVYSWKLSLKNVDQKNSFCTLRLLAGVIFGTGCVSMVTYVVLFMWVIFFQSHEEESLSKIHDYQLGEVRYERIDVAVDKNKTEDDEN